MYKNVRTLFKCVFSQSNTAGFGAVMAAEREWKLRSQHRDHGNNSIKKNDYVTNSPKFPNKQVSVTGEESPKLAENTATVVKEEVSDKYSKQKVTNASDSYYIYVLG